jgi:hypothetical protein
MLSQITDSVSVKGFGATQGVFREYYFKNPPFKGNQLVASIGLLVVVRFAQTDLFPSEILNNTDNEKGILQSLSPFLLHLIGNYPQYRSYMMWTGMVLVVASSLGAAFSTTVSSVYSS